MHRTFALPAFVSSALLIACSGCQLWPWGGKERTSIITPSMRAASIREMAARSDDLAVEEQSGMCEQLATQIRTEPDPIVRLAIQETIGEFEAPLATAVLQAGLNDEDRDVRLACCRALGKRGDAAAIGPLSRIVAEDSDIDVRLAAVDALGAFKNDAAIGGLAAALKDRDPALQFAGVQAMKSVTGDKELGNDVLAWRQYADRALGGAGAASTIATQPSGGAAVK